MDVSASPYAAFLGSGFEERLRQLSHRSSPLQSYPRPRTHRVTKPSSTGNSPRNLSARRSTLATTFKQPQLLDQQGEYHNIQALGTEREMTIPMISKTRPISWHPTSHLTAPVTSMMSMHNGSGEGMPNYPYPQVSYTTTQVNGLITPLSQPCYDEPFGQEAFSSLDESQPYEDPYAYLDEFRADSVPDWAMGSEMTNSFDQTNYNPYSSIFQQAMSSPFTHAPVTTAPPSPDFLPIQGVPSEEPMKKSSLLLSKLESTTDELVGMGLYDPPTPFLETDFDGKLNTSCKMGKGLKLEEMFEPSPVDEEDDDNDEDDNEDGEGEDDDVDATIQSETKDSVSMGHSTNLANRSFFFEH